MFFLKLNYYARKPTNTSFILGTLHLDGTNYLATAHIDQQKKKSKIDTGNK